MASLLRMPEVAANTAEAVLLSWPTGENTRYDKGEVIAVVETAKAVVDVEADAPGTILRTLVAEGTEVKVGEPIALIGETGEEIADVARVLADLGYREASDDRQLPAPVQASPAGGTPDHGGAVPERVADRVFASPIARRLARAAGIPFADLQGSGPNGRIVRRDVEAARRSRSTGVAAAPVAADPPSRYEDVPHSRQARFVAARLTQSKATVPHFYLRARARVDALLALRADLNAAAEARVSVNDLILRGVAMTQRRHPALNVQWTDEAIRHYTSVDVGVAIASAHGLVVPVVRGADELAVSDIAQRTRDYIARAAEGRLRQAELDGGCITVSNLGMYGIREFDAIINPPQAAILAVGAAGEEAVVHNGELGAARVTHLTLSVDHRVADGAAAAEWLQHLVGLLEQPLSLLR